MASDWLSHSMMMKPEFPDWLEELTQKLAANDPGLCTLELIAHRLDDQQAVYLSAALKTCKSVNLVIFSCHQIYDEGASALATAIADNDKIDRVQLRDLRRSREVSLFFHILSKKSDLRELSLRHCQICSKSTKMACQFFAGCSQLEEFRVVDSHVQPSCLSQLCMGIKISSSLERLYLVNASLEGHTAGRILGNLLRNNSTLEQVVVSENELGDEGIDFLSEGMSENNRLRSLDLRSNGIGTDGAQALAGIMTTNKVLTHICVSMNRIGEEGCAVIMKSLKESGHLKALDLSDNEIGEIGAKAIADTLQENEGLEELNLSFNNIGNEGAMLLASSLVVNTTLQSLAIRRNRIRSEGAAAFGEKLPSMRGLKELILVRNKIGQEGAAAILTGLRHNMELEHVAVEERLIHREILYWLRLNKAGRRVFRNEHFPGILWPTILARINGEADKDTMFHFLKEKPSFLQTPMQSCPKR